MNVTSNKGFTLVELLVAMAIGSIVLTIVGTTYQVNLRSKNTQEALNNMNQTVMAAMEVMTADIRMAGFDTVSASAPVAGIVKAETNELHLTMDIGDGATFQPDGDVTDPNENVRYALSTESHLGRDTGAGLMPLARNVDALNFVYLNGDNPPVVIPSPVAANLLNTIRSIQVTVVARAGEAAGEGFIFRFTNDVAYLNQQGTQILAPQNDSYRRALLSTTIQCRNIGI